MNGIISFKELKELFKNEKSLKIILVSGMALILAIALSGISHNEPKTEQNAFFDYNRQAEYEEALESKLCAVLSEINGIGSVKIMITLDSSEENMFDDGDDEPVSVKTPSIRGVIVVCDGGDNILIREKVISAVSGAFGISTTRVSVIK